MNIKKYWMMLAIALVSLCIISCGSDDDNEGGSKEDPISANDPEGTITVNLTNYGRTASSYGFGTGEVGNSVGFYVGNLWKYSLAMNNSNNFVLAEGNGKPRIICIGKTNGIAGIKEMPEEGAGWAQEAAIIPGYGYISKAGLCIVRIYVVDYIENTTGGIIGATIKYQLWNPE